MPINFPGVDRLWWSGCVNSQITVWLLVSAGDPWRKDFLSIIPSLILRYTLTDAQADLSGWQGKVHGRTWMVGPRRLTLGNFQHNAIPPILTENSTIRTRSEVSILHIPALRVFDQELLSSVVTKNTLMYCSTTIVFCLNMELQSLVQYNPVLWLHGIDLGISDPIPSSRTIQLQINY